MKASRARPSFEAVFVYGPGLEEGGYPPQSPFDTSRPVRTRRVLREMGFWDESAHAEIPPAPLERSEMELFHEPSYLDALEAASRRPDEAQDPARGLGTPDCPVFQGMYDYVRTAAGGTLTAARLLMEGRTPAVFNSAGGFHHAMPGYASGFCYLNDVVLATETMARSGRRVCVLDIDAHHGDGVQHAFYGRRDVLFVSLHESGRTLFPGTGFVTETGEGEGRGYTLNIPLPVGTYDEAYERVFRTAAWPVIRAFDPDVIVLEIGMDTLAGDPLAHLHLTNNVPAEIVATVRAYGKPVLAVGGGGYHIENTVRGWALCWGVLCGRDHSHDLMIGMGGVMLENTEWSGGLRDRVLLSDAGVRFDVDARLAEVVAAIRRHHFPVFGLA